MVSRLSGRCESGLSKKNEHKPRLEHVCVQPGLCLCFYALQCTACDFQSQFTGFGARPPTSIFVFVYTNALLARSLCLKKLRSYLLKIVLVFSLSSCGKQCLWLSIATNYLLGLPQTPVYAESILRLRVHGTLPMRAAQSLKRYLISKKLGVLYSTYEADRKNLQ